MTGDVEKMSVPDSDARPSILIVDDDPVFRSRLEQALHDRGYDVRAASDAESAAAMAREESPEFAVVDLRMPGRSGLELVRDLKTVDGSTRIVVLTGYGSIATAVEALRLGAHDYLTKPADLDGILAALLRNADDKKSMPVDFQVPSLARTEWEHIHRVLSDCHGNVSEAARRLGIHRRSLQRKLNRYPPRS
jgi:two-component system response regulator RegA